MNATSTSGNEPRIIVMSRQGCHLCEQALATVTAVAAETAVTYRVLDVSEKSEWEEKYGQNVPVIIVDGEEFAHYRVDAKALKNALQPNLPFWRRLLGS